MKDSVFQKIQKSDRWYWGMITGILFPLFWYILWWLFFVQPSVKPDEQHIRYGFFRELNMNILRICVGLNLILFYFFLNRNLYGLAKGIIISVLLFVLIFLYLLYVDVE